MAALKAPFEGQSLDDVYGKVKQCIPDHIPKGYSEKLQTIIMKLVRKDPKDRITMNDLLALPSVKKKAEAIFGDKHKFEFFGLKSKLLSTLRLPRKEVDIVKLVSKTSSILKEDKSHDHSSLASASKLYQSEPSLSYAVKKSTVHKYASSNDSKFSLASLEVKRGLQPRISNLQRDLHEHRVAFDKARETLLSWQGAKV